MLSTMRGSTRRYPDSPWESLLRRDFRCEMENISQQTDSAYHRGREGGKNSDPII